MGEVFEHRFVFAPGPLWIMTLWLWSYFPQMGPGLTKVPDATCYGDHYSGAGGRKPFEKCFRFFYSDLTDLGTRYMPFERDTMPNWLKNPATCPGDKLEYHKEM